MKLSSPLLVGATRNNGGSPSVRIRIKSRRASTTWPGDLDFKSRTMLSTAKSHAYSSFSSSFCFKRRVNEDTSGSFGLVLDGGRR